VGRLSRKAQEGCVEFTYRHYVAVLRAKKAEWAALKSLAPSVRASLTPLIELTPDIAGGRPGAAARAGRTTFDNSIHLTFTNLQDQLTQSRVFLDFGHLRAMRASAWALIRSICGGPLRGLVPVVTAPACDGRLVDLRTMTGNGVGACVRVPAVVLARQGANVLSAELQALNLNRNDVDLIIDLGCEPRLFSHDQLRAAIPSLDEWRSWTVLAGVFPLDLTEMDANQLEYRLPRDEWVVWRSQILAASARVRRPSFGDFTIQYGEYVPAPKVAGSLSVRYTLETEYLVLRGRRPNAGIGVGFDQYYGHARYPTAKADYYGATFSAGDEFIKGKCATGVGPGDRGQWLTAGINHHLTATVAQLAAPGL
jgi:T4 beta protein